MNPTCKQLASLSTVLVTLCAFSRDAQAGQTGFGVGTDDLTIGLEVTKNEESYLRNIRFGTAFGGGLAYAMDFMGKTSPYYTSDLATFHVVAGGGFGAIVYPQLLDYTPATVYASPIFGTSAQFRNLPLEATVTYRITPIATFVADFGPVSVVDYFGVTGHIHMYF